MNQLSELKRNFTTFEELKSKHMMAFGEGLLHLDWYTMNSMFVLDNFYRKTKSSLSEKCHLIDDFAELAQLFENNKNQFAKTAMKELRSESPFLSHTIIANRTKVKGGKRLVEVYLIHENKKTDSVWVLFDDEKTFQHLAKLDFAFYELESADSFSAITFYARVFDQNTMFLEGSGIFEHDFVAFDSNRLDFSSKESLGDSLDKVVNEILG